MGTQSLDNKYNLIICKLEKHAQVFKEMIKQNSVVPVAPLIAVRRPFKRMENGNHDIKVKQPDFLESIITTQCV